MSDKIKSGYVFHDETNQCYNSLNVKPKRTNELTTKVNFLDYSSKIMNNFSDELTTIEWEFERFENNNEKIKYLDNYKQQYV